MTAERAKRHHYIPRFLVKNWANNSDIVWVLNQQNNKIFQASVSNIFVEGNRFTIQGSSESSKSDQIEKMLAQQERKVAPVINRIIAGARKLSPPQLNEVEFLECQKFLVSITRRTPESVERILAESGDSILEAMKEIPAIKDYDPDDLNESNDSHIETMDRLLRRNAIPIIASGQIPAHQLQVNAFSAKRGLESHVILNPRRSLLLGSYGYFEILERTKDKKIRTAARFPVAPDITLAFTYHPDRFRNGHFERLTLEDSFVRKINTAVVASSNFVISRDKQLLVKYRNQKQKIRGG